PVRPVWPGDLLAHALRALVGAGDRGAPRVVPVEPSVARVGGRVVAGPRDLDGHRGNPARAVHRRVDRRPRDPREARAHSGTRWGRHPLRHGGLLARLLHRLRDQRADDLRRHVAAAHPDLQPDRRGSRWRGGAPVAPGLRRRRSADSRRLPVPVIARTRPLVLAIAGLVVLRSLVFVCWPASHFDSDQAVTGLMAKHLSELRAFPVFWYGQTYMLGVEAWLAAPVM